MKIDLATGKVEEILRGQTIDERQPGSILRDFEIFLNFVGSRELVASGLNELLPMTCLRELNAQSSKPLDVALQRPQQKSFPNVNGLFLLGRASGLLQLERRGKEKIFILDEQQLNVWRGLNPTERYFTLLEAWLVRGSAEILGEDRGGFGDETLYQIARLFEAIPPTGLNAKDNKNFEFMLPLYKPYNIALSEMFGWLEVEDGAGQKGKSWVIEKLKRTPFGDAAVTRLIERFKILDFDWLDKDRNEDFDQFAFNALQPVFKPYFPEWRNVFRLQQPATTGGVYIFKVSLDKKIWRKIAIPANCLLDDLSDAILAAFDFDNDHLYQFSFRNRFGVTERVVHPICEEPLSTDDFTVGELPLRVGETMEYLFDFGDQWEFTVELEKIDSENVACSEPEILEKRGEAPPQYYDWDEEE